MQSFLLVIGLALGEKSWDTMDQNARPPHREEGTMSASDVQAAWVGARVRDERKRLGWTGRDLAEHAGVSHNTVVAIEQGRRVREGTIAKVREALGVELDSPLPDPYTEAAQQAVTAWLTAALTRDEQRKRLAYIVTAMAQYGKESISVGG